MANSSRIIPAYKCKTPLLKSVSSPKLLIYLSALFAFLFILFQSLQRTSWGFTNQWQKTQCCNTCLDELNSKLQESVTFLPLKDLRYSSKALEGHTWFMSSILDTHEKGQVQYQEYPSKASKGRVLCLKGRDTHDGSWNSYALAWPRALPPNATLMEGLTFVSYNHYDYSNIWHGISAVVPFIAWHLKNKCSARPARWVLYHWGELRIKIGPWLSSLLKATFGEPLNIEKFNSVDGNYENTTDTNPACFERAVVMRHNEGGMSRERRLEVYDLLRWKARAFCNVSSRDESSEVDENGVPVIGMTMFMRTGARSFKNDSAVIRIFTKACQKVDGCRLKVAYANNLSFCKQVRLMSLTDILVSPHGAQLTNMFLMDRNGSVMEFFPKGWLKLAGVGQYVYHWIASWSGMKHQGAWRDPGDGDRDGCPFAEDDRRCMTIYKDARIGYNESYFSEWARNVASDVKLRNAYQKKKKYVFGSRGWFPVSC